MSIVSRERRRRHFGARMSRADARRAYDAVVDASTRDARGDGAVRRARDGAERGRARRRRGRRRRRRGARPRAALVDVRSPGEHARGRVPRAVNAPLFSDDERAAVGTAYKTKGRGEALVLGMGRRRRGWTDVVEEARRAMEAVATTTTDDDREDDAVDVYVMCFRGGMRSSCVGWLLKERLRKARVFVVDGGYKAFRRWALERCGPKRGLPAPRVCVVGGRTGVGKTRALLALRAKGEQIIDLEGLANHAGSAFGWVGREPQPTSEHYSNLVACEWHALDASRWVFIEDEGPHVGRCSVDPLLFERMRNAPLVLRMVAPREVRLHTLWKITRRQSCVRIRNGCPRCGKASISSSSGSVATACAKFEKSSKPAISPPSPKVCSSITTVCTTSTS